MSEDAAHTATNAADAASTPTIGRRGLLGLGAAGVAAGVLPAGRSSARSAAAAGQRSAKNVVFVVSDGMSTGTMTLAEMMRDVKGLGPSHWSRLWQRPGVRRAACTTYAADGWVTDSAAAGSAWGIGEHINNRAINFTPEGRTPEPIFLTAKALGKATGLVTTTRLTHATPAAFIANVPSRDLEQDIANQMIERGVDIALGGGARFFSEDLRAGHDDLIHMTSRDELLSSQHGSGRVLGVFDRSHLDYEIDRPDEQPSLSEMARAALDRLSTAPDGFVLQIEGGRVDHGAHANDAPATVFDQIAFDEAVGVVAEWAGERDDTLVIVTTDHGNANPGLTYYGSRGVESFERLANATGSFDAVMRAAKAQGDSLESLADALQRIMAVDLTESDIATLRRAHVDRERTDAFDIANGIEPAMGAVLANHFGVAFVSPNHTADLVEVTAFGPGSEAMPHLIDNVDLHTMAVAAMTPGRASHWTA
ncbi:MAG: alkaline phosphatase [Planctomycetota bacterium]